MKFKNIILNTTLIAIIAVFASCKKTPGAPPVNQVAMGPAVTIQQLRNGYAGINQKFTSNTMLNVVVTADEFSGNLYKQVYVRDNSGTFALTNHYGAIALRFLYGTSGFLTVGDSIAVNLNGATLSKSGGGSLEIDSLRATTQIVHLKTGLNPQPIVTTLPKLNTYSNTVGGGFIFDAQLVQLNSVEFVQPNVNTTYAIHQVPPAAPQNVNKYISDSIGNTIVAYNSGYANFANDVIPNNSGSIIAVANLYTTMQLTLRSDLSPNINFSNPYNTIIYDTITQGFTCQGLSSKSDIMAAGWTSIAYQGSLTWLGTQYGNPFSLYGNPLNWKYAPAASNYKSIDGRNDMWLISPPISDYGYHNGSQISKYIDFSSAIQYPTSVKLLSIWVSNTFDGTHLIPSQWVDISGLFTKINQTVAPPNFQYAHNSSYGSAFAPAHVPVSVGSNSAPNFYIAFRYQTNINVTDSTGSTYFLGTLFLRNN